MSIEAKVGLFVIAGTVMLGAGLSVVRTTQMVRGQVPHKTSFRYAGGLAPGATVLFGGIKVGQITAVQSSSEDPTRIEIVFRVRAGTPLNEDSMARVGAVSVMSNPALAISTGSNAARRLTPGEAVRSEEAVGLDEVARRVATVADSANTLVLQLQKETSAIALQAHTLLANLNRVAGIGNRRRIENILAEMNTLIGRESPKIAEITDRISTLARRADATVANVNGTVDAVRDPLLEDLAELAHTISEARALLGHLDSVVSTNEVGIADIVKNLRATSENIQSLTESVKRQPWSLIRIKQPQDRKVPQ
jgi:ABC-type transporter Mla subunit MlaD